MLAEAAVVRVSIKWVASVVEKGSIEVAVALGWKEMLNVRNPDLLPKLLNLYIIEPTLWKTPLIILKKDACSFSWIRNPVAKCATAQAMVWA